MQDNIYFCPSQVRGFANDAAAAAKGYSSYTACGVRTPVPTPTATPEPTPKPLTMRFTIEDGDRFPDIESIAVARLPGGTYRSYTGAGVTSFEPDTLRYSDSADGITFGTTTAVFGIAPETQETFANPTFVTLDNGSFMMVYEEIKHISSAGVDIHNLMRAVSSDGANFSYEPANVVIPGGSLISSYFAPALVRTNEGAYRLFYSTISDLRTVLSSDSGASWSDSDEVTIYVRSDSYAPYPGNPSVILNSESTYLMFFTSPATSSINRNSIFLADSSDGINFYVFDEPVLSAPAETSYHDPSAVRLPDGSIRLYFVSRTGSGLDASVVIKSARSAE